MKKLFEIRPNDGDGVLWELTSFLHIERPESYQTCVKLNGVTEELADLLTSNVQEYPDDKMEVVSELDVLSYLSSSGGKLISKNGVRVDLNSDTFKEKHVCICCFTVPFQLFPCRSMDFHSLINLCNELCSLGRDEFKMVVVIRTNNSLDDTKEVFDRFLSGFPEQCLAIPFEDSQKRDYVCDALGLGSSHDCNYESLFLNDKGQVLKNFWNYGAEAFPFSEDVLDKKHEECREIVFEMQKIGLEKVLKCNDSSPQFVHKIEPSGNLQKVSISDLSHEVRNKHVGIYLCSEGSFIPYLWEMYQKCKENEKDFEIVVVNMPFYACADPKVHQEMIESKLQKQRVSGWYCLPFNNSVSQRFSRLTGSYDVGGSNRHDMDKLIVVGLDLHHLEMYGANVMKRFGIDAFPFNVDTAINITKEKLEKITLQSLFVHDDVTFYRGKVGEDSKTLSQLASEGKKVVVCIDTDYKFKELASVYEELREKRGESCDFEMVFVEVGSDEDGVEERDRDKYVSKMPWYVCPHNMTNSANVEKLSSWFWEGIRRSVLVGFGEIGQLCSYRYRDDVFMHEVHDSQFFFTPLDNNLEKLLEYDELNDHRMQLFLNPRRR